MTPSQLLDLLAFVGLVLLIYYVKTHESIDTFSPSDAWRTLTGGS